MEKYLFLLLFIVAATAFIYFICSKIKILGTFGTSGVCFATGVVLSFFFNDKEPISLLSDWFVCFAIPLMLFSINIKKLKDMATSSVISFIVACASAFIVCTVGGLIFRSIFSDDTNKVMASLSGLFVGGQLNMAAIANAIQLPGSELSNLNTCYLVAGGGYLIFACIILPPVARLILPKYVSSDSEQPEDMSILSSGKGGDGKFSLKMILDKWLVVLAAIFIVGISTLLSYLITHNLQDAIIQMLAITTLSILFSLIPKIRETKGTYEMGNFLIDMFCLSMGMMFHFSGSGTISSLFIYIVAMLAIQVMIVGLHILIARIIKIDADTTLITSAASILSPAFIPPIARFMKNQDLVAIGLIFSIFGFVVANYVGFGVYLLLNLIA